MADVLGWFIILFVAIPVAVMLLEGVLILCECLLARLKGSLR